MDFLVEVERTRGALWIVIEVNTKIGNQNLDLILKTTKLFISFLGFRINTLFFAFMILLSQAEKCPLFLFLHL